MPPQVPGIYKVLKHSRALSRAFVAVAKKRGQGLVEPVEGLRAEVGLPRGRNALFDGQQPAPTTN